MLTESQPKLFHDIMFFISTIGCHDKQNQNTDDINCSQNISVFLGKGDSIERR